MLWAGSPEIREVTAGRDAALKEAGSGDSRRRSADASDSFKGFDFLVWFGGGLGDSIRELSDEEVLEEFREGGGDPELGRRAKLYFVGRFACRECAGLRHGSKSETRRTRLARKALKIRDKVGGSDGLVGPFPPKPPGMWWRTYSRLREQEVLTCPPDWYHSLVYIRMALTEGTIGP